MKIYQSPSFIVRTSDRDAPQAKSDKAAPATQAAESADASDASKLSEMKRRQKRLYDRVSMFIRQKQQTPTDAIK